MTYEEMMSDCWQAVSFCGIGCKSVALMVALLHIRYEQGFVSRCSVSNERLEKMLSIDVRTLRVARKQLIDCGLIEYEEGKAKRCPVYVFTEERKLKKIEKEVEVKKEVKKEEKKKKEVKEVIERSMFSDKEMKRQPKRKPKTEESEEYCPFTLEDVQKVFRERGLPDREAEYFFSYYDAQGWVTNSGQKIRRLDSMVNRWVNNIKKIVNNGNNRSDIEERRARFAEHIARKLSRAAGTGLVNENSR